MRTSPRHAAALLGGAALLLGASLAPAFAQPGPGGGPGGPRGPMGARHAQMFAEIDADKDGRVTWQEVWVFVQDRFAKADADRSGGLTQAEMQTAMPAMPGGPRNAQGPRAEHWAEHRAEMMGAMFRALDADRNGQVTLEEIRPAVEARFRAADANGDNVVVQDELPQRPGPGGPRGAGPGGPPPGGPPPGGAPQAPAPTPR